MSPLLPFIYWPTCPGIGTIVTDQSGNPSPVSRRLGEGRFSSGPRKKSTPQRVAAKREGDDPVFTRCTWRANLLKSTRTAVKFELPIRIRRDRVQMPRSAHIICARFHVYTVGHGGPCSSSCRHSYGVDSGGRRAHESRRAGGTAKRICCAEFQS